MSPQDVARKAIEAFNRHDANAFAQLYAADAVAPDPQYAKPLRGREAIRKDIEAFFGALPDVRAKVVGGFLASDDSVAFEVEITGTHTGPLVPPDGPIPATNRRLQMTGGRFVQVNGQDEITHCRRYYDISGLMDQLGLVSGS